VIGLFFPSVERLGAAGVVVEQFFNLAKNLD
jgi:hypothetical protein